MLFKSVTFLPVDYTTVKLFFVPNLHNTAW